jgi:hypothetical protein
VKIQYFENLNYKNIFLIIFLNFFCHQAIAKEYIYTQDKQILPNKIELSDKKFQNDIFSYFNKDNILDSDDKSHLFNSVLNAKIHVEQINPLELKVNVILDNKKIDWYIPRFEEKSVYSEKKIYLISDDKKIIATYPRWWPKDKLEKKSPRIYIPKPEHIGLFAKIRKGESYKLEYIIQIPDSNERYLKFNLFYQDYTMPYDEIYDKYSQLNEGITPELITKSNIVKVSCKRVSENKDDGYTCEFSE